MSSITLTKTCAHHVHPYRANTFTDHLGLPPHEENLSTVEERDGTLIRELIGISTAQLKYPSPSPCQRIQLLLDVERFERFIRKTYQELKVRVEKGQCFEVEVGIILPQKTIKKIKQLKRGRKSNLVGPSLWLKRTDIFVEDIWCAHQLSKLFELKVGHLFPNQNIELARAGNSFKMFIMPLISKQHFLIESRVRKDSPDAWTFMKDLLMMEVEHCERQFETKTPPDSTLKGISRGLARIVLPSKYRVAQK
jgi:hypothetical protein